MHNKTSNRQITELESLSHESSKFKNYTALGPGILDILYTDFKRIHPRFRVRSVDPRDFAVLDHKFGNKNDLLWYLEKPKGQGDGRAWKHWLREGKDDFQRFGGGKRSNIMGKNKLSGGFLKLYAAGKAVGVLEQMMGARKGEEKSASVENEKGDKEDSGDDERSVSGDGNEEDDIPPAKETAEEFLKELGEKGVLLYDILKSTYV